MYGGSTDTTSEVTALEKEQARSAVLNYNEYINDKPVIAAYLNDINKNPAGEAAVVQGQAAADLAQKTPEIAGNPNGGMNPSAAVRSATLKGKIMNDLGQDTVSQQAAGKKAYIDNAMGLQSSVNSTQSGMARDAVEQNIADAKTAYNLSGDIKSSVASAGGMAAAAVKDYYAP